MVMAIDGPAGAGKSSLAQMIAERHNLFNLNSGSFYRAVAVKILDDNLTHASEDQIIAVAESVSLEIVDDKLHLDGHCIEDRLRNDQIDHWSSVISAIGRVRHAVNGHLRRVAENISLVAEGRDMTTVVFPDAEFKIFLTASPEIRARRRYEQGTSSMSLMEIERNIRIRDQRDSNKTEGSLRIARNAKVLDSTDLTLIEVCAMVDTAIRNGCF